MIPGLDGPDRADDRWPLTDRSDVEDAREALGPFDRFVLDCAEDCVNGPAGMDVREERDDPLADLLERTITEIEGYDAASAEELGARRDLELWGYNPFDLEDA